jgi:septal ring factor EnvC (AmiA/AmiB activator)
VPPTDRPRLKIVAVIVTFAVIAALAIWGWTEHSSAADWKARAVDLETELASTQVELDNTLASLAETQDELDSTEATLSETQEQLAAVEEQLRAAEAQVEALDAQVATLANTKAQVEDERAQLSAILATAPAVTTALRACASSNVDVSGELLKVIQGYPYRPLSAASALLDDALEICQDAIGKANDFEATLSALGL